MPAAAPLRARGLQVSRGPHVVLDSVEGRRLTFRVSVKHRDGLIAAGKITRVVVERSRFLGKAAGTS